MPYGYHGRILHIDLTQSRITVETPPEAVYRTYFGGQALGAYYLHRLVPRGADPLGPDNVLVFTFSPLTGVAISGQSRFSLSAKSPVTGGMGTSEAGGFWPAVAKANGYDGIIIRGRATEPVYLWLHEGQAELRPATHVWGRITGETEDVLKAELGDSKVEILQIGPAGERQVAFAAVINMCSRANGRTGMGAVMGSKNLKAIVVRGKTRPRVADPQTVKQLTRWGADHFEHSGAYSTGVYGTAGLVGIQQTVGGLPTRNWSSGVFEGADHLTGERMAETILRGRDTCYACIVRCKRIVEATPPDYSVDPRYGGPEFETIGTFGSLCGVSDLTAVAKAHELCAQYGLDTITTGSAVAWAMDLAERNLLSREQLGRLALGFGRASAMLELVRQIAQREGLGALLADGIGPAAQRLGPAAQALALEVKGNALPVHMPQLKRSMALIYAVNPHGADHQSSEHDVFYMEPSERMAAAGLTQPQPLRALNADKVRFTAITQRFASFVNSACLCQFVWGLAWQLYDALQLVALVRAVTAWDITLEECLRIGERSVNLMRAFNYREGLTAADDRLPARLYHALQGGPSDGMALPAGELEAALAAYYAFCGWDAAGTPTPPTLAALGLDWLAQGAAA